MAAGARLQSIMCARDGCKKAPKMGAKKKKKAFGLDRRHTVRQRLGHRYRVEGAENWREQGKRIQRRITGELFLEGVGGGWYDTRCLAKGSSCGNRRNMK